MKNNDYRQKISPLDEINKTLEEYLKSVSDFENDLITRDVFMEAEKKYKSTAEMYKWRFE